jgi:thiol-disulfide isomerase/thioredoxin
MAIAGVGALLAVALTVRTSAPRPGPAPERLNLAVTLKDMNGADVRLDTYAGRPIVINLWATWCGPCRLEMPQLIDLYAKFKDRDLVMIGVSVDDTPELIRPFAKEFGVTYPLLVGLDHPDFLAALGYTGAVPMTIFIRKDGTIAERVVGIATTLAMERRILALFE